MERIMIEEATNRNLFKKCLRDTVREPEIDQDAFVTSYKRFHSFELSESDCSGNRKDL